MSCLDYLRDLDYSRVPLRVSLKLVLQGSAVLTVIVLALAGISCLSPAPEHHRQTRQLITDIFAMWFLLSWHPAQRFGGT